MYSSKGTLNMSKGINRADYSAMSACTAGTISAGGKYNENGCYQGLQSF
jgi:hypothetical protein